MRVYGLVVLPACAAALPLPKMKYNIQKNNEPIPDANMTNTGAGL